MADWLELDDVVVAERGDLAADLAARASARADCPPGGVSARGLRPARRRTTARPAGAPGQCRSSASAPARRTTERSAHATTTTSSA